jgi:hypothetical protein
VAWGVTLGFDVVTTPRQLGPSVHPTIAAGEPVLLASGFDTVWRGDDRPLIPGPFVERRFSYRGLGPDGEPLPYTAGDTHQSLAALGRLMSIQVEDLARRSGRPVSIVAESEGSLVAKTYLLGSPGAPVDQLVLLSPLVEPARVYYPPASQEGWGVGTGWMLRWLTAALRHLSPVDVSTTTPLFRSMVDEAPAIRDVLACPITGVRQLALFPLADAVAAPHPTSVGIPSVEIPAFHGGLLANRAAGRTIAVQLEGRRAPRFARWSMTERVLRAAGAVWQVPVLPLTLNPAWREPVDAPSCSAMAERLTVALRAPPVALGP